MRTQGKNKKPTKSAGKRGRPNHDRFSFGI